MKKLTKFMTYAHTPVVTSLTIALTRWGKVSIKYARAEEIIAAADEATVETADNAAETSVNTLEETVEKALHIIDAENLCAGCVTYEALEEVWDLYSKKVHIGSEDSVHVAIGWKSFEYMKGRGFPFPGWVQVHTGGYEKDAADKKLLELIADVETVASIYGTVVIASGDAAFIEPAKKLKEAGVKLEHAIGKAPTARKYCYLVGYTTYVFGE